MQVSKWLAQDAKKAPVLGTGHQSTVCIILHIFCKINKFMHFVAN